MGLIPYYECEKTEQQQKVFPAFNLNHSQKIRVSLTWGKIQ